jgi:hypothetical protein
MTRIEIPGKAGKGALSELRFRGVAVLQWERGKRLAARISNVKVQNPNVKLSSNAK